MVKMEEGNEMVWAYPTGAANSPISVLGPDDESTGDPTVSEYGTAEQWNMRCDFASENADAVVEHGRRRLLSTAKGRASQDTQLFNLADNGVPHSPLPLT